MKNSKAEDVFSVLIPDGESWLSYSVQSCLARIPGIEVLVLSSKTLEPMRFSRNTGQFFSFAQNSHDDEARLEAIRNTIKRTRVDVVLPIDTQTIRLVAAHRASLQKLAAIAPVPDVELIDMSSNKWLLAEWLREHQIPSPTTLLYMADPMFTQALAALSFPVLLKPAQQIGDMGIGGRGIHIFDHPSALLEFCRNNESAEYVVQPFIKGYDIDCSVLCQEGKIQAHTIQKGFLKGDGDFSPPAGIEFLNDADVYALVKDLVKKMNWSGVAHFDLRYDEQDQQVKVIEINTRFWGSLFGSLCAGINFPYLTCRVALGLKVPKTEFKIIRYLNGGTAAKILGRQILLKKQPDISFDYSALGFIVKDPLPKLVAYSFKIYSKVLAKFSVRADISSCLIANPETYRTKTVPGNLTTRSQRL